MNSLTAHLINLITLQLTRLSFNPYKNLLPGKKQAPPLLISGIFRSGTSITTNILSKAGFDAGPQNHLLQATSINPDGYFENYFFMDFSRYLFHLTNSYGDNPPEKKALEKIELTKLRNDNFRKFTLLEIHDDRVKNIDKMRVLRKVSLHHMHAYLANCFGERPLIKNPHFSVLEPFFRNVFHDSKRLVVFRNPSDWKHSAQAVSPESNEALYDQYYSYYLHSDDAGIIFFNYDQLLKDPEGSVAKLLHALEIKNADAKSLAGLVRKKEKAPSDEVLLTSSYSELLKRAINS
ncbi:MAG: sulfotransferase [Bacteroidota bacterium]|nr:sulfotransferase [Bacteroidota bacterium]